MLINLNENSELVLLIVQDYVDKFIFNTNVWDGLETEKKLKAIYNSYKILVSLLPDIYGQYDEYCIDIDDLVSQIMWLIKRDDSTDRADQGATMLTMGEMTIMFDPGKTGILIAPELINKYGLSDTGKRRRVGRYYIPIEDTARTGLYKGDKERFRYE